MRFNVIGRDSAAAEASLEVEAADRPSARRAAAAAGVVAIDIRPVARAGVFAAAGTARTAFGARAFALDLFCQELLAMLEAGVTLREALETLSAKEQQGARATAGAIVGRLLVRVQQGLPLSSAMAEQPQVFPVLLAQSMRAAERTSDYAPALARFVRYRRQTAEMRHQLVGAALYPAILLGVSAAVLLFLLGYVVPRFAQVYVEMGERLPAASRVLMQVGLALGEHPLVVLMGAAGLAFALAQAWRSGALGRAALALAATLPSVGRTLHAARCARLYRTLALLLAGGLPLVPSLALARGVVPEDFGQRIDAARDAIREGRSFSGSLAEAGLTTLVSERFFRVGERTGRLAEMIERAADFHEEEIARGVDRFGRLVGPLMMLAMGSLIGVVVVLMYLPIFQLAEALQ